MRKINKNIWFIYYVILLLTFVIYGYIYYQKYQNLLQEREYLDIAYAKLVKSHVNTTLWQTEAVLDALGIELLLDGGYKDKKHSWYLLESVLKNSHHIIAYGLVSTDGTLLLASKNIDTGHFYNILTNKAVKESFEETLHVNHMVVGRPYYFARLKEWVIPVRKAVKDSKGRVLGVMTAGISINKAKGLFKDFELSGENNIVIARDVDSSGKIYRLQVLNTNTIAYEKLYGEPVSDVMFQSIEKKVLSRYRLKNLDHLRSGKFYYIENVRNILGEEVNIALGYLKKYKMWIVFSSKSSSVYVKALEATYTLLFVFIAMLIMFYFLFLYISVNEKNKEKQLKYRAIHDPLTNLYNRNYMLSREYTQKIQKYEVFDVVFLDLDNFKTINDKFGHTKGDLILQKVAKRIKEFFDAEDVVIRQGGDEFVAFHFSQVKEISKLIEMIAKPYIIDNVEYRIGVSIGVARYPQDSTSVDELFRMADIAIHEAKKIKNTCVVFTQKIYEEYSKRLDIEHELKNSIAQGEFDEFYMMYQPQINREGRLFGVEALVRWESKKLGFVGPQDFISIAEDTGLIIRLGEFIIQKTLQDIAQIHKNYGITFNVSINISLIQFLENGFYDFILKAADDAGIATRYITIEVTESLALKDLEHISALLQRFRDAGFEISIDDFGTGYSSLSLINKLPLAELKVDKQFVDEVSVYTSNALIKSIFLMAKNFSFRVVCEGTETQEQVDILKEMGCDIFQGYYYSKPLKKQDLIDFIKEKKYI